MVINRGLIDSLMTTVEKKLEETCPFKTVRKQCLLLREEKKSETSDQNFPCNCSGNYKNCGVYTCYREDN